MLRNPIYVGDIPHRDAVYPQQHRGIIDRETFEAAQALLDLSVRRRQPGKARPPHRGAPLTGLVYDSAGHLMSPVSASRKGGATYRYYVSCVAQRGRPDEAGVHKRVPAPVIETMVREAVAPLLANAADSEDWLNVRDMIDRVEIHRHELVVRLDQTRCDANVVTSHGKLRLGQLERDGDAPFLRLALRSIAVAASPWWVRAAAWPSPASQSIQP